MPYQMTLEELRAAYIQLGKYQHAAKRAVERMESEILSLQAKNAILEAQKVQWDADKGFQGMAIQEHLAAKDREIQSMALNIEELRARLREQDE